MAEKPGKLILHQENAPDIVMDSWSFNQKKDAQKWGWSEAEGTLSSDAISLLIDLVRSGVDPYPILASPAANCIRQLAKSAGKEVPTSAFILDSVARLQRYQETDFDLNGLAASKVDALKWTKKASEMARDVRYQLDQNPMLRSDFNTILKSLKELEFDIRSLIATVAAVETVGGSILEAVGRDMSGRGKRPNVITAQCAIHAKAVYTEATGLAPELGQNPSFESFLADFLSIGSKLAKITARSLEN